MLSIISFTETGKKLAESITKMLRADREVCLYTKEQITSLREWAGEQMRQQNAMLFIGACGIAVRAVAPFLTDKLHDAPVLVMDEKGKFIIPILSGHMGGANELANELAKKTGAEPVITTATDINQKFAVDLFAKRNGLLIVNKEGIAKVSSKALSGKELTMSIESGHRLKIDGVRLIPYPPKETVDIVITTKENTFDTAILLRPKEYIIGMGCRRGKSEEEIEDFVAEKLKQTNISMEQVYALASISQKSDEQGLIAWCKKKRVLFLTYSAEKLQEVKGNFTASSFVAEKVGVDNVCERAALKACGKNGKLIATKYAENGMAIAIAKREWTVCFDDE